MKSIMNTLFVTAAAISMIAACSSQPANENGASAETTVSEEKATLLASVDLGNEHSVNFLLAEAGFQFMTETGKIGVEQPRLVAPELQGKAPIDVYRALAPNAAVPRALLDARTLSAKVQQVASAPTDSANHHHGSGPSFYTSGEQSWFKSTFCPGAVKCIQGWDWIDSGWDYTTSWESTAMVGSEGSATVVHRAYYWNCSGSCTWTQFYSINLAPGHYTWITGGGLFYYKSNFSGAGGNTQVSMAINDAPYQCGHCNDGSCQCGYMDPGNLCSGHGGNDPNIGCSQTP